MSYQDAFVSAFAGVAIPRDKLPNLSISMLRDAVCGAVDAGLRTCALFAHPATHDALELVAVLADDANSLLYLSRSPIDQPEYPAFTSDCAQVHLFEREIAEQWGVRPVGHPWLKPVRFHRSYRPGRDIFWPDGDAGPQVGVTDFYRVEGAEVHEVAVGPVHAGVIEPGHFRFQCHGEEVFHLEISLGYQHRGVERALIGAPHKRAIHYAETLAGDTTIGHATAYCEAIEALGRQQVPEGAQALRAVALELERLANHTGDLGALANDVGFLPTAAFCGRLRGEFLNLTALLCGSRFGRGLLRPSGCAFDLDEARRQTLKDRLTSAHRDVRGAAALLFETPSVQARFEGTGAISHNLAKELGLVGVVARACGLHSDIRHDFPSGIYRFAQLPVSTWHSGDVFARAQVRRLEIERSVAFLHDQLAGLPPGPTRIDVSPELQANHLVVTLVEGWRGEICHVALTGDTGRIAHYKVVDPSFHNWQGLAMALRNQEISDFPLCNKSFNLSYCGADL